MERSSKLILFPSFIEYVTVKLDVWYPLISVKLIFVESDVRNAVKDIDDTYVA